MKNFANFCLVENIRADKNEKWNKNIHDVTTRNYFNRPIKLDALSLSMSCMFAQWKLDTVVCLEIKKLFYFVPYCTIQLTKYEFRSNTCKSTQIQHVSSHNTHKTVLL